MVEVEKDLEKLVQKIVKLINPNKIYLYGDYVINKSNDYSLCVLVDENSMEDTEKELEICLADKNYKPSKITLLSKKKFKKRLKLDDTLESNIVTDGLIIYSK